MRVQDAMVRGAELVDVDATLHQAAARMRDAGVGALVVRDREELVGFVTDRDIVVRCVAEGRHPSAARVRDAMTPQVVTCQAEDDLAAAAEQMERHLVRRLVVLGAGGAPAGLLSVDDLAAHEPGLAGEVVEAVHVPGTPLHHGATPGAHGAAPRA